MVVVLHFVCLSTLQYSLFIHQIIGRNVGEDYLIPMLEVLNGIMSVLNLITCSKLDEKNSLWKFPKYWVLWGTLILWVKSFLQLSCSDFMKTRAELPALVWKEGE